MLTHVLGYGVTPQSTVQLGATVRDARRAAGLTQQQLATQAGVTRQWLIHLERGHPRAELYLVLDVLNVLGLTLTREPVVELTSDEQAAQQALDELDALSR